MKRIMTAEVNIRCSRGLQKKLWGDRRGHGGALAESTPFVRRVMGSTPALAAT